MASISGPSSLTIDSIPAKYTASGFSNPETIVWNADSKTIAVGFSADGNVLTIDSISNVSGTITITAKQGGTTATKTVSVSKKSIAVTSFSAPSSATTYVGTYVNVSYSYSPANATDGTTITASGGNSSIATCTVSTGNRTVSFRGVSEGSTTYTFSNSSGLSFSVTVTVKPSSVDPVRYVTSISASPSTLYLNAREAGTVRVTVSPSNADNLDVSYLKLSAQNGNLIITKGARSGATTIYTVEAKSTYTGGQRIEFSAYGSRPSADVSTTVYVELPPVSVREVSWSGVFDDMLVLGETDYAHVQAVPLKADNPSLSISVVSGADKVSTQITERSDHTYSVKIAGLKLGSVTLRATAQDGSGATADYTFEVVESKDYCTDIGFAMSKNLQWGQYVDGIDVYVRGYRRVMVSAAGMPVVAKDRSVTGSVTKGSQYITLTYYSRDASPALSGMADNFWLNTLEKGTGELTFVANDEKHFTKAYTVHIGDPLAEYDHTVYTRITGYVSEEFGSTNVFLSKGLDRAGGAYKVHSGCAGSIVIPGCYFVNDDDSSQSGVNAIPPVSKPWVLEGTPRIRGTPTEEGLWYVYVENQEGVVSQAIIDIGSRGTFTKTIKFDANVPSGKTLKGTLPKDMVAKKTNNSYTFVIPESDISVDGYIFIGWREYKDNTVCVVYNEGNNFPIYGENVTKTLYAEWFPVPEGATGKGTEEEPFHWTVKAENINITIPNVGDYPIRYRDFRHTDMPAGVKFVANGRKYDPDYSITLNSGLMKIEGTAKSGVRKHKFEQRGVRNYTVYFALTILHENMPDDDEDDGAMFTVTFDGNGGISDLDSCSELYGRSIVLPGASRKGYELDGWYTSSTSGKSVGLSGERYVIQESVILYAHWSVQTGVSSVCYLRSSHNGLKSRIDIPVVESISDTVTSSLTTLPTIIYGVENTYVIDLGNSRKFSVNITRVVPPDYSDTSTDPADWSNGKWLREFFRFIDFWQNFGRDVDTGRNTGGMRFHFEPISAAKEMYPVIDKNVFISGQISVSYPKPHQMRLNLPLQVASMDIKSTGIPTEKVTYSSTVFGMKPFTEYFVSGGLVTIANTPQDWSKYAKGSVMLRWSGSDGNVYYPGDVARLESGMVLTAEWGNPITKVFEDDGFFDIPSGATRVLVYLVGGGGAGASSMAAFWVGGAGGAGRTKSVSLSVKPGQTLSWTIGKGGKPNGVSTSADNFQTNGGDGSESIVYLDGFKILSAEGGKGGRRFASGYRWSGTATGLGGNGWGSGGSTYIPTEDDIADDPYSTSNTKGGDGNVEAPNTSDNAGKGQYGGITIETAYNEEEAYVGGAGGGASGLNVSTVYGTYASKGGDGGYLGSKDTDRIEPGDGIYGGGGGSGPGGRGGDHLGGSGGDGLIVFFVY